MSKEQFTEADEILESSQNILKSLSDKKEREKQEKYDIDPENIPIREIDGRKAKFLLKPVAEGYTNELWMCELCNKFVIRRREGIRNIKKYCDKCKVKMIKGSVVLNSDRRGPDKKITPINRVIDKSKFIFIKGIDGHEVALANQEEVEFYKTKMQAYTKDFNLVDSADYSLLSRLIALEIEARRTEMSLTSSSSPGHQKALIEIIEQIRLIQRDLGITRSMKLDKENSFSEISDIIEKTRKKFDEYRLSHPEMFMKCENCGHSIDILVSQLEKSGTEVTSPGVTVELPKENDTSVPQNEIKPIQNETDLQKVETITKEVEMNIKKVETENQTSIIDESKSVRINESKRSKAKTKKYITKNVSLERRAEIVSSRLGMDKSSVLDILT